MADEIRQYTLTIPAGTPSTAPVSLDTVMPPRTIDAIEIVIPPGVNGVCGFQIRNSNVPVIPYGSDAWIIANAEVINWPLTSQINSGSWQLAGYNTGTNDHKIFFRFLCNYLTATTVAAGTAVISAEALNSPDTSTDVSFGSSIDLTALGD
jgi:hypothetical protein